MPLVMGVDSSTQSTKVEVRDADTGRVVGRGRAPHPPSHSGAHPPRSEQDPRVWWDALSAAVAACGVRDVDAVSVAAQQHGLVVLDAAGAPVRPAKLWNDTESAPQAAALVARLGADRWATTCGSVPVAAFTVTKLAWLATHEPHAWSKSRAVLLPHDYLTLRLTGRAVTDRGDASGTGYWSPFEGRWASELLHESVGPPPQGEWVDLLPDVLGPTESAGHAAPESLGLRGAPMCGPGTGDNMAAALGVGLRTGDVAMSLGTSGTVYAVSDRPVADPTGAVAGFADATGRFLPLVCTLNATLVTDAVARLVGVDHAGLDRLALSCLAGAGGVVLVPYFAGERTPNRPNANGLIAGLRPDVSKAQLARAAYEGVVCGLLDGLDALGATGVPIKSGRLLLVGGGSRSHAYQRIVADLTGMPVTVPDDDEQVAAGACVQAAAVLHRSAPEDVAEAWGLGSGRLVEPDPAVDAAAIRDTYAAARDR